MSNRSYQCVTIAKALLKKPLVTASCVSLLKVSTYLKPLGFVILVAILTAFTLAAQAQGQRFTFNIPQQGADSALRALADQADLSVVFDYAAISQYQANAIRGHYRVSEALKRLLAGTDLRYEFDSRGHLLIIQKSNVDGDREMKLQSKKKILAATIGFFLGSGSPGLLAQEASNEGETAWLLEEIVVTAQKREQRLIDVPMSVAALGEEEMAVQGITDLQSLSLAVPGLLVAEGGSFQRRISIRGIGNTFGSSSLVGLYLDESSVSSLPANQIDLRVHDIERVEVLKGPQGTLYGEGSVGGTIRYITNDPDLSGVAGRVELDGSNTQDGDTSQEVKGVLNLPLSDTLGVRLVGQYIDAGGWIDQPALDKKDINDYELYNIRGKLLWQLSDEFTAKATAITHRNDTGAQNVGEDESGDYYQPFADPTTPSGKDDYDFYSLDLQYDFTGVSFSSVTSFLDSEKQVNNWGLECCTVIEGTDRLWQQFVPNWTALAEVFSQEFRLSADGDSALYWTAGLFYKDAKTHPFIIREPVLFGVPGGALGVDLFEFVFEQEENSESWAVFGELSYNLTDQLEIGAGIRYFEDDREFKPSPASPFKSETFDSVNPKFYISYALSDDIRVYANAAKGFRSGGFNAGAPAYDPEEVWSYELGSKMNLLNRRLNIEGALFYSEYESYQITGSIPSFTSNAGNGEVQGVELLVNYAVSEQFEVGFNGNYMDTEFIEINAENSSHAKGDPLDVVPRYGFGFFGQYFFDWFDQTPGFFRVDYNQQGKSNYRNRTFGPDYHSTSDVIDMLNARLGWQSQSLAVELYGTNLLDERGFIGPFGLERNSARPRPRTLGVNISYQF